MNYLYIAIITIAAYFAPNAVAQNSPGAETDSPDAVISSPGAETNSPAAEVEITAADKPASAPSQRLAKPLVRYISDEFYVPLRESPCRRCTIVHRGIKSGTKMKLLELRDGWALVVTDKDVEGWMEQQHLVENPVARNQLTKNDANMKKMVDRNSKLENILSDLRKQSKSLRGELNSTVGSKDNLVNELAAIKEISSDAIALNDQNQELAKQNHMLQRENDVLKANLNVLQKDKRNQSFLYGGLTVFLGAILVVLIPKLRGRKRFSEWQ
jgi:SH3 domain protein